MEGGRGGSGGGENAGYGTLLVGCSLAFFHVMHCLLICSVVKLS